MSRWPPSKPVDEDEVARLYNAGASIATVAAELGTSRKRVADIVHRREDVAVRKHGSVAWVNVDPCPMGDLLREHLAAVGISHAAAARRLGVSRKYMSQVMVGSTTLSVDLAVQMELVLGVDGRTLLRTQADHEFTKAHRVLSEEM